MKFVDSASVRVEAGKGGAGASVFVVKNTSPMVALMVVMVVMVGVFFSVVKKV